MQTKIMVMVQIRKKRELPSEGVAISQKLTENWYMAPTVPVYLPNYCRSVWGYHISHFARGIAF